MSEGFKWYVVNCYSGNEEKAKLALMEQISIADAQCLFGEIVIPKMDVEKITVDGKKSLTQKTSYPGYIIVQMELTDLGREVIKKTPKISGFVGNIQCPKPLSDEEVIRLTSPELFQKQMKIQSLVEFEKGETVKVKEGPFTNFNGVVEEVKADKMKLRILVSIFGRETPVELSFSQVEKIK